MFLTRENNIFAFQNIAITTRETRRKEILTNSVSGSPTTLYNKHQTEQHTTAECGLRTVDCGQWIQVHTSVKKLFCLYSNS